MKFEAALSYLRNGYSVCRPNMAPLKMTNGGIWWQSLGDPPILVKAEIDHDDVMAEDWEFVEPPANFRDRMTTEFKEAGDGW